MHLRLGHVSLAIHSETELVVLLGIGTEKVCTVLRSFSLLEDGMFALMLATTMVALLLRSPDAGDFVPAPQVVQDGIMVMSPQGPVATWGRGLEGPVEAAIVVVSDSAAVAPSGELRKPW